MHGRALALASCLAMVAVSGAEASDWMRWRGPFRTGMAVGDAPLQWDDETNFGGRSRYRGAAIRLPSWWATGCS